MSDYIDRQAAIDAVNGMPDCPNGYSDTYDKGHIIAVLEDVPSVHPHRWIPVTEALPRDDEEVIVTCLDDSGDTPYSYTTVAWHYKDMWVCDNMRCPFVIAWMPLPEPYKEGQNDT